MSNTPEHSSKPALLSASSLLSIWKLSVVEEIVNSIAQQAAAKVTVAATTYGDKKTVAKAIPVATILTTSAAPSVTLESLSCIFFRRSSARNEKNDFCSDLEPALPSHEVSALNSGSSPPNLESMALIVSPSATVILDHRLSLMQINPRMLSVLLTLEKVSSQIHILLIVI